MATEETTATVNLWRTDKPPVGELVEVWHDSRIIKASHNGQFWQNQSGTTLLDVTHWRPMVHANS